MAQARETAPAFGTTSRGASRSREADAESNVGEARGRVLRSKKPAAQRVRDAAVKAKMEAARDAMRDELQALDDEIERGRGSRTPTRTGPPRSWRWARRSSPSPASSRRR